MRFDVISILPDIFDGFSRVGVVGRAFEAERAKMVLWNPRDYTSDKHRLVDDRPYGGGSGMVLMAPPLAAAIDAAKEQNSGEVIYLAPRGEKLTDQTARQLAACEKMVLVCGRYRGIDERLISSRINRTISVGDYVLSGGEVAAMALIDAVLRHCPGVLGNPNSRDEESFADEGMLDSPVYTRPAVWEGNAVPPTLISGNHNNIKQWRQESAQSLTQSHTEKKSKKESKKESSGNTSDS